MNLDEITELIQLWAIDKDLDKADPAKQMLKLAEEHGELAQGMAKNRPEQVTDSIGDMYVVLTILSVQLGLNISDCIEQAYEEIKDRKGKMIDGVFVKQEDLEPVANKNAPYSQKGYEEAKIKGLDLDNWEDYLTFYKVPF